MSDEQPPVLAKTLLDELAMVALPLVYRARIYVSEGQELSPDDVDAANARDAYHLAHAMLKERVNQPVPNMRIPYGR